MLIVCGDVSDELAALETALATLKSKFGAVFYVPGGAEEAAGICMCVYVRVGVPMASARTDPGPGGRHVCGRCTCDEGAGRQSKASLQRLLSRTVCVRSYP